MIALEPWAVGFALIILAGAFAALALSLGGIS